MNNTTLAQIIRDRMEAARAEIVRSWWEANEAAIAAEDRAADLHKIARANPNDEIARKEYAVAAREFRTMEAIVGDTDRIARSLSIAAGGISENLHLCARSADRLHDATEAAA